MRNEIVVEALFHPSLYLRTISEKFCPPKAIFILPGNTCRRVSFLFRGTTSERVSGLESKVARSAIAWNGLGNERTEISRGH